MSGSHKIVWGVLLALPWFIQTVLAISPAEFSFPSSLESKMAEMGSTQCLVVSVAQASDTIARIYPFEKKSERWSSCLSPVNATIGRHGLAVGDSKREGDGKTPAGVFPLGLVFGYAPSVPFAMPYRQATKDDIWVDDPASPDYNRWVSRTGHAARSFEEMKRSDDLYKWGMVIEYNTHPIIPGKGSAIFFHLWAGPGKTTSGCVAIDEKNMERLLPWLDPSKKPCMAIGMGLL